jgi:hypothetical protein
MPQAWRHQAGVCTRRAEALRLARPEGGTRDEVVSDPADNTAGEVVMS